jgi:hypothetical protein
MSMFLRLLGETNKVHALALGCAHVRQGLKDDRQFEVDADSFTALPGSPFAYWVTDEILRVFARVSRFENVERTAKMGLTTNSDFRFLRTWWEDGQKSHVFPFAKGGIFSPYYADLPLTITWDKSGQELKAFALTTPGTTHWSRNIRSPDDYFRPGMTWPRRTTSGLSMRVLPAGCIFADKGPAAFVVQDRPTDILALLALVNSRPFAILVSLQLAAADAAARSYEVGVIQRTPLPTPDVDQQMTLAGLARRAWALKRELDSVNETSHAFLLPATIRINMGNYEPISNQWEITKVQRTIDTIAFELYGFSDYDSAIQEGNIELPDNEDGQDEEEESAESTSPAHYRLLSWAVGTAFGRFDWRIATGERQMPPEPDPFDPLPKRSPGMLPDGDEPFHAHQGILMDEKGHQHDLPRLVEEVLSRVGLPTPDGVRRWLQRDFFAFHLQSYSKSRRKAPIYWPLSTSSGNYTLWIYYPSMTSQTLYTGINDFVEPKLKQVGTHVAALRNKGIERTRDDEKQFESVQSLELELLELRDTLLQLAPTYKPNQDDGVQITAAPLWPLFRHKPWQKILKETWTKLEKGDYDWAHLAVNYWPERVREKCKTDKSLAIAHGLENLYIAPEAQPKKARGKKKAEVEE